MENPKADNSGTVVILHSVNHQSEIQELLRYSFVFLPFFVFTALKAELMDAKDRLTTSEKEIESLKKNAGNYSKRNACSYLPCYYMTTFDIQLCTCQ